MKRLFGFCVFLLNLFCHAQSPAPGWQLASGGSAAAQPVATDYGFAVLLEGRTLAAVSVTGAQLWETALPGRPEPFLGTGNGNFIYVVTDGNILSVYNPSGLHLWAKALPSKIISAPKQGRDGRIFIQCETGIGCYSAAGILKWFSSTEESAGFPLYELEDGSLLFIQRRTVNGGSTGLRLSPFGTSLEEITFTGIIRSAAQSPYGAVLIFEDGSTGCCSSRNNAAESRWMLQPGIITSDGKNTTVCIDRKNGLAAYIVPAGTNAADIVFIQLQTGAVRNRFSNIPADARNITHTYFADKTLVLCDSRSAAAYTESGQNIWQSQIPARVPWSYLLYLDNGYLAVFEKNTWITSAYRMTQKIGTSIPYVPAVKKNISYPVYTGRTDGTAVYLDSVLQQVIADQYTCDTIYAALLQGNYGESEAEWISLISAQTEQLLTRFMKQNGNSKPDVTVFDSNLTYSARIIRLTGAFGTEIFNTEIAALIMNETDISMISAAVQAAAQAAYDPDSVLLNALQQLVHKKNTASNRRIAKDICDAVYEICRFMGKPALFSKGIDILRYFFYPQFDRQTKEYASETMQKIIALQM